MKATLKRKLTFVRHRHSTRIDPRARAAGAFDLLETCFTTSGFRLLPKSEEFKAAKYATQTLLRTVDGLGRLVFWANLRPRDEFTYLRKRTLATCIESLEHEATLEDIVDAMDAIYSAVKTMSCAFREGRFDPLDVESDSVADDEDNDEPDQADQESRREEEDEEDQEEEEEEDDDDDEDSEREFERDWMFARYKCAALLPYLAKRMREVWVPIKKRMSMAKKTDASAR